MQGQITNIKVLDEAIKFFLYIIIKLCTSYQLNIIIGF